MDVETPSRGRDRTELDQGFFTGEEEGDPPKTLRQD
jgi:hypothetical protein